MTHIEKVDELTGNDYILIRPKRTVNIGDTLILECDGKQQDEKVINMVTKPGLIKGWQLLFFERESV